MQKHKYLLLFPLLLVGCASFRIDSAVERYQTTMEMVDLGDTKQKFLSLVYSSQTDLKRRHKRAPEKYMKEGVRVEIYYMRSDRFDDELTTDDEFVPYVFNDGILVAVGWQSLGGPKTQGQARDPVYVTPFIFNNTN